MGPRALCGGLPPTGCLRSHHSVIHPSTGPLTCSFIVACEEFDFPSLYLSLKSFSLGEIDTLFWQPCYPFQSAVLSGFELWAGLRLSLSLGNVQANPKPSFKIRRSMETDHLWVPSPLRWALSRVRTSQPVAVCSEVTFKTTMKL